MEKKVFGSYLKRLREQAGLSQRGLAEKVGVDVSYLSKIENGVMSPPSQELIIRLAEVLDADRDELLTLAGKVPADIAQILKNRDILQSLRKGDVGNKPGSVNNGDSFNKKLRELRERAGLSQSEVAERVGVSFTYLSKIETGVKPPPSEKVILKLAEVLNCDKDDLMASAGKVPSDVARILKNREVRQSLRESEARRVTMRESGNRKGISLRRIIMSASGSGKGNSMKNVMNGKNLVRVALAFVLVFAVATSLWLSSPSETVRALKIDITNPSGAPLQAGTIGQSYAFQVKVNIETGEALPIQSVGLSMFNSANSSYTANLVNLPINNGGSVNYTAGQTGGGSANVTVATNNFGVIYGVGNVTWLGQGYTFPTGYGYGAVTGNASITYNVLWTPPLGWPVGNYNITTVINANGTQLFTKQSTVFVLQSSLMAETGISQGISANVANVIALKASINRIKSATDNTTANISGGIGSYSATVMGAPANAVQFLTVYGVAPFNSPTFDNVTGVFGVPVVSSPIQANNTPVAEIVAILTGSSTTNVNLTQSFQLIGSAGTPGLTATEEMPNTMMFVRGNAKADDPVDIFDALFIAQYIVGQKTLAQLNPLNAASVKHDGPNGDVIDIFDALFIAQLIVGQKNSFYQ